MKIFTYTTAIIMAVAATSVFAHHPSEDMNPNFDRVDAQLEAVDSPHLDLTFDDMGSSNAGGDSDMSSAETREQASLQETQLHSAGAFEPDLPINDAAAADTIDLLENVAE
jgi:hypothetical protein